ncbi:peptide-methionine (S)-S-oxide reductase MsrA [Candidatus Parvarchaeota archaeon]|nr:peptide-methionine (S)-S-oxide reductase MsrA [Candidatus Parvarchaeota archaeon]
MAEKLETAVLAGGCFWCMEAVFKQIKGIEKVESGYCGGTVKNPSYEQVCTGKTGHAESVRLTFNPSVISYEQILKVFFTLHDPTSLNRQGNDVGSQYRSEIFYADDKQRKTAEETIKELTEEKLWDKPIVTALEPLREFYVAENYHQDYYKKNPLNPYCFMVIRPKISKLRKEYLELLKKD